ncbi:Crp/Fnr family transcriptional regulator [Parvibaculum sp.]|jgi:CRP-like cAMP-binding protein|uniref:Crp/Fnr family transcriptional regulator n=1 Tax=Parvibaculum sp. TaxID=2024848 RepID=UPI001B212A6B|nr:Crp/Fnr family transcriptional regulator [Parvibaculum sp.]MBO6635925.1 Crp/Fnr family transcriptional regulator [Parvibaculum sp.]MBO6678551.1 Crp/Fnr family transcriptional regulator [Parvibaculum sp.]MBO6684060.1 Crp/Fnr family transcriptional regulator [Parvibaculum sp.]MBO6903744.1 Crp/Fnr family transcriptional regulator [Parvibaculum sp.]
MPAPTAQERIAAALARNHWFMRRPPELRQALIRRAQLSAVEGGHWLYDTGDEAVGLYGVLTGSVTTHLVLENGASAPVNISGPGTIFGYAAQVLGGRRVTTTVTREPSEIIFVPQHALAAIAHDLPSLWLHFAELATEQLVFATRVIAERSLLSPRAQLAARLHVYALAWGNGKAAITLPILQEELAELMGLSRKTVNRILRDFEKEKLVETGYRSILILNPRALHRIAMEETK